MVYAGAVAVSGTRMTDAQLSAAMSDALGVATIAVSARGTLVIVYAASVTIAAASSAAAKLASATGAPSVPFQLTATDVKYMVPMAVSGDVASAALGGPKAMALVPAVCISVYVDASAQPSDMGPAMALLPQPLAVATDSMEMVPVPAPPGRVSKRSQRMLMGWGAAAIVLVVAALGIVTAEVAMRSGGESKRGVKNGRDVLLRSTTARVAYKM